MPDIQRGRGGEGQRAGEKEGDRAKHALHFNGYLWDLGRVRSVFNAEAPRPQRKRENAS
jgi:hypothetical protein